MRDFRDLTVWQKAHKLALAVYSHTAGFPKDERFGLTAQVRRAAVSVASNIAEGRGRNSDRDFARFLSIAAGSLSEVECQLLIACDLGYEISLGTALAATDVFEQIREVRKLLSGLMMKLGEPSATDD